MDKETTSILAAWKSIGKAKQNKVIVEETTAPETSGAPAATSTATPTTSSTVTEEQSSVAKVAGAYTKFTGTINIPGIYGKVQDANFVVNDKLQISFNSGTWLDGTWAQRGGLFNGGVWKDGLWKTGSFMGGVWEKGIHKGGIFSGGTWKDGLWEYGSFDGGTWEDGTWKDGDWSEDDTKWIKGKDSKGVEHTEPPFAWGDMKYSKVTDPSANTLRREREKYGQAHSIGKAGLDTFDDESNPTQVYSKLALKSGMKNAELGEATESCISEATKKKLNGCGILGKMVNSVKMIKVKKVIGEEEEDADLNATTQVDEKKKQKEVDPLDTAIANYEAAVASAEEQKDEAAVAVNRQMADWLIELKACREQEAFDESLMKCESITEAYNVKDDTEFTLIKQEPWEFQDSKRVYVKVKINGKIAHFYKENDKWFGIFCGGSRELNKEGDEFLVDKLNALNIT